MFAMNDSSDHYDNNKQKEKKTIPNLQLICNKLLKAAYIHTVLPLDK